MGKVIELKQVYNNIDSLHIKNEFSDEEYSKYLDFGIKIGDVVIKILDNYLTKNNANLLKMRMSIIDEDYYSLISLQKKYKKPKFLIKKNLNKSLKVLDDHREEFVDELIKLFNEIDDDEILNYLLVGIFNTYNKYFLIFILRMIDENLCKKIFKKINKIFNDEIRKNKNDICDYDIEEKIYNLINFPLEISYNLEKVFYALKKERDTYDENNNGYIELEYMNKEVEYESSLEKQMIDIFSKCSFVKDIKTQSLSINYNVNNKIYKYYPDLQLLLNDGSIVIIEIKPLYFMASMSVIPKYNAMVRYCEKNGYGYLMLDNKFNTYENLKKLKVEEFIEDEFILELKSKKVFDYYDTKKFMRKYKINIKQIYSLIIRNSNHVKLKTLPFEIYYDF